MKYYVEAYNADIGVRCEVNARADAAHDTIVKKAVQRVYNELNRLGLIGARAEVYREKPNVWLNGGVGFISLSDGAHNYTVSLSNEYGSYMYV